MLRGNLAKILPLLSHYCLIIVSLLSQKSLKMIRVKWLSRDTTLTVIAILSYTIMLMGDVGRICPYSRAQPKVAS
jgi:hypothetical protein